MALKDITIGQYFPGHSFVHRMDPRMKMIVTFVFVIMLFCISHPAGLLVGALFLVVAYGVSGIPYKMILKSLKPVVPIILFTGILNIFFIQGDPLFHFWFITVYKQGVSTALFMAARIILLIAGTSLLTYTSSPISLTDAIEQLFGPLKKLHFPVHELAMMMTIALRFIPTLIEETDKIMNAQKARGADMESGGLVQRAKSLIPILIPLFVSAFRRADELALAMECRCYRGGEGRTRMRQLKYTYRDAAALGVMAICFVGVFLLNRLPPLF